MASSILIPCYCRISTPFVNFSCSLNKKVSINNIEDPWVCLNSLKTLYVSFTNSHHFVVNVGRCCLPNMKTKECPRARLDDKIRRNLMKAEQLTRLIQTNDAGKQAPNWAEQCSPHSSFLPISTSEYMPFPHLVSEVDYENIITFGICCSWRYRRNIFHVNLRNKLGKQPVPFVIAG